ncbi:hypothetical protein K461DRAFT_291868 [Myriangium duriaei CBS 260.36]|uniref:Pre-mRNA-splicing factor SPF27 n=1 Tax=Myriangium duriaei CBS 260.36 TaxID=1168546 RepID=A0A9P4J5I6_9PEZI|nr:hypothetical protein K461DRAFT_291868 [Myriangium duriaei CBS 260.36]
MPLIQSSQDHLPDIDSPPSPTSLSAAKALIAASLPSTTTDLHPSLPPLKESNFTPALTSSLDSLSASTSPTPLDLSRYEAPSAPTTQDAESWTTALRSAALNSTYLSSRATNLSLLETFGRNAWLVSNAQLEDLLRDLERDVKSAREELEGVERERRERMEAKKAEVLELERAWRDLVGRGIEVQVAAEKVREEILARRRAGAREG